MKLRQSKKCSKINEANNQTVLRQENNKGLKLLRKRNPKKQVVALKNKTREKGRDPGDHKSMTQQFYEGFHSSKIQNDNGNNPTKVTNVRQEGMTEIREAGTTNTLTSMKNNKATTAFWW